MYEELGSQITRARPSSRNVDCGYANMTTVSAEEYGLSVDLLIVDDDSQDRTREAVESLGLDWVRLHVLKRKQRDLSSAVMEGFALARHAVLMVMDADLSHPPEAIPQMLDALDQGYEFVLGSRYVAGGSHEAGWGLLRWINSRVAVWMARPLTAVRDPMSGYFALRRETLERAHQVRPSGYKIGLELLVKCGIQRAHEVPIHFAQRHAGQSKLSVAQGWLYLKQVVHLLAYRLGGRHG